MSSAIWDLGYQPTEADPHPWLKPAIKPSAFKHCEMMLCHVDNVTVMSEDLMHTINGTKETFKLKGDEAEMPDVCLGGDTKRMSVGTDVKCWTPSSKKHIETAVEKISEQRQEGKKE